VWRAGRASQGRVWGSAAATCAQSAQMGVICSTNAARLAYGLNKARRRVLARRPVQPGGAVYCGRTRERLVALTFDDGPSGFNTESIVRLLGAHGARATFFVVGREAESHTDVLRRTVEAGHELGNHTFNHRPTAKLTSRDVIDELRRTSEAIEKATGMETQLARPPWGNGSRDFAEAGRVLGLTTVLWSLDSGDALGFSAPDVARHVVAGTCSGHIVLLHDGSFKRDTTLAALETIITGLDGYRFVTVSELLAAQSF